MKVLVTGGAGFIGSAVIRLAIARGHSVVNADALTYAACLENVASVTGHPNYAFEQVDIRDRAKPALGKDFVVIPVMLKHARFVVINRRGCLGAIPHKENVVKTGAGAFAVQRLLPGRGADGRHGSTGARRPDVYPVHFAYFVQVLAHESGDRPPGTAGVD